MTFAQTDRVGFTLNTGGSITIPGRWTTLAEAGYEPAIYAALREQQFAGSTE